MLLISIFIKMLCGVGSSHCQCLSVNAMYSCGFDLQSGNWIKLKIVWEEKKKSFVLTLIYTRWCIRDKKPTLLKHNNRKQNTIIMDSILFHHLAEMYNISKGTGWALMLGSTGSGAGLVSTVGLIVTTTINQPDTLLI